MVLSGKLNEDAENIQDNKQELDAKNNKGIILSEEELQKIAGGSTAVNPEKK